MTLLDMRIGKLSSIATYSHYFYAIFLLFLGECSIMIYIEK